MEQIAPTAVLPGPRRHTRTSKGSPLVKPRDDINKLTGKSKQKLEVSSPVVEPTTPAESVLETHHIYQEAVIPHPFAQPLPNIEEALEAAFEGQQDLPETHVPSSHDFHGEESTSVHDPTDSTDSDVASWLGGQSDAENTFLQRNGYTVPLSNEALAAIRVVLGKEAAIEMASIRADSSDFQSTLLEDRNVQLEETTQWIDPEWEYLHTYDFGRKPDEPSITNFLDRLWLADLDFCRGQQEAMFQRTVMMAMINRHQLISAGNEKPTDLSKSVLMFSVEATWNCPPMPTRRYWNPTGKESKIWTTYPKPDLCVSFRRHNIIEKGDWNTLPNATRHLICYEGIKGGFNEADRAFGFFFVEAKRSRFHPDHEVTLHQVLNDASQALHNMYEFFREAQQLQVFFDRVRVFSAATSEKGIIVRVHRATELPENAKSTRIVPEYPLQFEHQTYQSFNREEFDRSKVVEAFERIIVGYGERQLLELLKKAAADVGKKANHEWVRNKYVVNPAAFNDYRYGQYGGRSSTTASKLQTPAIEGSQSARTTSMPPPSTSTFMQGSHTSGQKEVIDQTMGRRSSLSQGVAELQTGSFGSQSSEGSRKRTRDTTTTKQRGNANKKRKANEQ
ncbi:MAG: hypothetical protein Q9157_002601 [Trypethelium eluteriae]